MLAGRKILITNGDAGVGFAIARAAAAAGADVAVQAERAVGLDAAETEFGGALATVLADLSAPDAPARAIAHAADALGGLDGLVIVPPPPARAPLDEATAEHLDAHLASHVRAPVLLARAALPHLEARPEGGSIVIASTHVIDSAAADLLAYEAAQAALAAAIGAIARTLRGRDFRINQISGGLAAAEKSASLATPWRPEDVAQHVIFWLSDQSAPANGRVTTLA